MKIYYLQEIIKEWKIEGDNLILISQKEKAHNDYINYLNVNLLNKEYRNIYIFKFFNLIMKDRNLIKIGNGHFASASDDKTIKIW